MNQRRRITIQGTVQGVGFRPFVYRLALEEGLTGLVRNEGRGVLIEVQGPREALDRFGDRLPAELPAPGRIVSTETEDAQAVGGKGAFVIAASRASDDLSVSLAPDGWTCPDCLAEMADPAERRHRYPFTNCTRCGPRYTITRALPYDRPNTTMAVFTMCGDCRREYEDPVDRRHHAQPIACPACGPRAWQVMAGEVASPPPRTEGEDPAAAIAQARDLLARGRTVAVKGIGGFHLAVDARDGAAVRRLRERKGRPRKPLALMVRDVETARRLVELDEATEEVLSSPAAPVLLAPARQDHGLPEEIAPNLRDLGVMLPYSPLHHLLMEDGPDILVMTSGNAPSEPITTDNEEALRTLPADAFLLHDREIHVCCDDGVVRATPRGPIFVRRSRGHVPVALEAGFLPARSVLALGAELKATVATLQGGELVVGRHIGDLDNPRAEDAYRGEVERMLRFGRVEPEAVAVDLHPDLFSTRHGEEAFGGLPIVRVQHHHAHMASVMVEHGLLPGSEVTAVTLDGLGYGEDGSIWGGEVLVGGYAAFRRAGCLRPVPQPGGDRAALEPRRMATSLLLDAGLGGAGGQGWDEEVASICGVRAVSPMTSSTGRLFDGVAAILGLAPEVQDYEGEAAARLEAAADPAHREAYPLPLEGGQLDTRALVTALVEDGSPVPVRAARFHNGLADGLAGLALSTGPRVVVLSGGSMVNRLLLDRLARRIEEEGVKVLWPRSLPPGDGGLSAGQAACAACIIEGS